MSYPRPYLFCPTLEHQKAVCRMLYALGYHDCRKSLGDLCAEIDEHKTIYVKYPYIGTMSNEIDRIDWRRPDDMPALGIKATIVNSVPHMRQYLKRRIPLTPGAPPS